MKAALPMMTPALYMDSTNVVNANAHSPNGAGLATVGNCLTMRPCSFSLLSGYGMAFGVFCSPPCLSVTMPSSRLGMKG